MFVRLALASALAITAQGTPAAAGVAQENALAMWVELRGAKGTIYIVFAAHKANPGRPLTLGGVGKIPCRVHRGRTFTNVVCNGKLRVAALTPDAFFVHPTLDRAHLTMRTRGRTHRARWRAVDERPDVRFAALPGSGGATVYAEMARRVTARGKVLGRRLGPRADVHFAELTRGGMTTIRPRIGLQRIDVEFRL